jgi:hypothetical protein
VAVRVILAGAIEPLDCKAAKTELSRIKRRMLARKNEARAEAALGERVRDGSQFDGFGPGADDQYYVRGKQPSP